MMYFLDAAYNFEEDEQVIYQDDVFVEEVEDKVNFEEEEEEEIFLVPEEIDEEDLDDLPSNQRTERSRYTHRR